MPKQLTTAKVLTIFLKRHRCYAAFCRDIRKRHSKEQIKNYIITSSIIDEALLWSATELGSYTYRKLNAKFVTLWNQLNIQPDNSTLADVVK